MGSLSGTVAGVIVSTSRLNPYRSQMSQSYLPRKRSRNSSCDSTAQHDADEEAQPDSKHSVFRAENLQHDDEFWLEDGSVVLIAGDVAFRVYRGLLASQSKVFADMFESASATQCARDNEMEEGCPIVCLSDSPLDVRYFLRVLLPKSQRMYVGQVLCLQCGVTHHVIQVL